MIEVRPQLYDQIGDSTHSAAQPLTIILHVLKEAPQTTGQLSGTQNAVPFQPATLNRDIQLPYSIAIAPANSNAAAAVTEPSSSKPGSDSPTVSAQKYDEPRFTARSQFHPMLSEDEVLVQRHTIAAETPALKRSHDQIQGQGGNDNSDGPEDNDASNNDNDVAEPEPKRLKENQEAGKEYKTKGEVRWEVQCSMCAKWVSRRDRQTHYVDTHKLIRAPQPQINEPHRRSFPGSVEAADMERAKGGPPTRVKSRDYPEFRCGKCEESAKREGKQWWVAAHARRRHYGRAHQMEPPDPIVEELRGHMTWKALRPENIQWNRSGNHVLPPSSDASSDANDDHDSEGNAESTLPLQSSIHGDNLPISHQAGTSHTTQDHSPFSGYVSPASRILLPALQLDHVHSQPPEQAHGDSQDDMDIDHDDQVVVQPETHGEAATDAGQPNTTITQPNQYQESGIDGDLLRLQQLSQTLQDVVLHETDVEININPRNMDPAQIQATADRAISLSEYHMRTRQYLQFGGK